MEISVIKLSIEFVRKTYLQKCGVRRQIAVDCRFVFAQIKFGCIVIHIAHFDFDGGEAGSSAAVCRNHWNLIHFALLTVQTNFRHKFTLDFINGKVFLHFVRKYVVGRDTEFAKVFIHSIHLQLDSNRY